MRNQLYIQFACSLYTQTPFVNIDKLRQKVSEKELRNILVFYVLLVLREITFNMGHIVNNKRRLISAHFRRGHKGRLAHFGGAIGAATLAADDGHVPQGLVRLVVVHDEAVVCFHGRLVETGKSFACISGLEFCGDDVLLHVIISICHLIKYFK